MSQKSLYYLLMGAILVVFAAPLVFAAPADDLQQKISQRSLDIEQIEKEIAAYKAELSKTQETSSSLKSAIQTIDLNRRKLGAEINLTSTKAEDAQSNIAQTNVDISASEKEIERERAEVAGILRSMDEAGSRSFAEIIFAHDNISDALAEIGDFQNINREIHTQIEQLHIAKEKMFAKKSDLEKEQQKLRSLEAQLADQKSILDEEKKSQNSLLVETKNKESNYKKVLADAEARKKLFEKELEDFAAQIKQQVDPKSFPTPGSHVLSAPLDGMKVTQRFGRTADSVRLYVSGTHNGLDLAAPRGTKVYSAADGTITATGNTDEVSGCFSYGKWVLIKHPNGLSTLYAHLDIIKAAAGQQVARGDLIGYSGKTGYATGPHLHFGVYASDAVEIMKYSNSRYCKNAVIPIAPVNAYLDPEAYL